MYLLAIIHKSMHTLEIEKEREIYGIRFSDNFTPRGGREREGGGGRSSDKYVVMIELLPFHI